MRNSRFGSSVACLGNTDGGSSKKVMVGAPYYQENGAVFVFRYRNKLELSQIIQSQGKNLKTLCVRICLVAGVDSRGFGLRLSDPQTVESDGETLTSGIAVASPERSRVYYIKAKPVPRLDDFTQVFISPKTIDPQDTKTINLTVWPRIWRQSASSVKLNIRGSVKTDYRLRPDPDSEVERSYGPNSSQASDMIFRFSLNPQGPVPNHSPVEFMVTLQYFLDDCTDTYRNPCPVFDNIEGFCIISLI